MAFSAACNDRSHRLFSEARRAMQADNYETAARLYQELTIQAPDSPLAAEAHYELAQIYYLRLRDADAAKDILVKMLDEYPGSSVDIQAQRLLARLYEEDPLVYSTMTASFGSTASVSPGSRGLMLKSPTSGRSQVGACESRSSG